MGKRNNKFREIKSPSVSECVIGLHLTMLNPFLFPYFIWYLYKLYAW
jgi:hypothetical protein